jgi:hypothetical protein
MSDDITSRPLGRSRDRRSGRGRRRVAEDLRRRQRAGNAPYGRGPLHPELVAGGLELGQR